VTAPPAVVVRDAAAGDLAAVAAIYNQGIAERVATFETSPRTEDDLAAWLTSRLPFLVATDGDEVLGWTRVSAYSDRCVYDGVGEHAVYVAGAARGRGVGRALLSALADASAARGLYKLTSRIFTDNTASRAAHRAAGFREVGVQERHGRLDGQWKDCVLVERLIGAATEV
jgi:phosphinothricin acetyltransferase